MLDHMEEINQHRSEVDDELSIKLNPREIADKNFDTRLRGFDKENQRLIRRVDELSKQLTVAKQTGSLNKNSAVTNYDILKRISNLERKVFGLKLDNSD